MRKQDDRILASPLAYVRPCGAEGAARSAVRSPRKCASSRAVFQHVQALEVRVSDAPDAPEWDGFLAEVPGGHHVQSSLWARVKATLRWRAVRVIVSRGEAIVGGAQVLMRSHPFFRAVGYVARVPVLALEDLAVCTRVLDALDEIAEQYRLAHFTIQPPDNDHSLVPSLLDRGFRASPQEVAPIATVQIDLRREPDELMARMKRKHRRYIRHGIHEGITTRMGDEQDLDAFHRLLSTTGRRQGFTPFSLRYFAEMWAILAPRGHVHLILAEHGGEPVSAQLLVNFGGTVTTKQAGWSGRHARLGPNYVMEWRAIEWARAAGCQCYDLEGIRPRAAECILRGESLPAATRKSADYHKLGFGGDVVVFPLPHVRIPSRILRLAHDAVLPRIIKRYAVRRILNRFRTR